MKRKISLLVVIMPFVLLASCAMNNPHVKTVDDRIKLQFQAITDLYTTVYNEVSMDLQDPTIPKETKKLLKREITPKLNEFKKQLIYYMHIYNTGQVENKSGFLFQLQRLNRNLQALGAEVKSLQGGNQ